MSEEEFKSLIMLDRERTRFEIVCFLLNTLNHLVTADVWYCYCEHIKTEKDGIVSHYKWKAGHCQICKIPLMFPNFERDIDKNKFNLEVLNLIVSNAFRMNTYTVVVTGTVVTLGAFP